MAADTGIVVGPSGTKKPWQSKTVILNMILAGLGFVAYFWPGAIGIENWIHANDTLIASIWGLLNVILRFASKDSISLSE